MPRRLLLLGLICLATVTGGGVAGQAHDPDRWTIVADTSGGVWRLDRQSGAMNDCAFNPSLEVACLVAPAPLNPPRPSTNAPLVLARVAAR